MNLPPSAPSLELLVYGACKTADVYLDEALRATSNLPKGLNRTAIIVAFMEAAASDYSNAIKLRIEQAGGNNAV